MNTRVAERHPAGALGRIGIVAGLHLAVIYLIATGLGIVPKLELPEALVGRIVDQPHEVIEQPPAIPQPRLAPPIDVTVPRPEVPIDLPDDNSAIGAQAVPDPIPMPPIEQVQGSVLQAVRADPRYPLTQPPYPPLAVRGNQEGAVEIEIYVLPNGRVGDARVVKSTGYPALDQSALDEAKRRWRLQPATRDGVPFAEWHRLRVVFELRNR